MFYNRKYATQINDNAYMWFNEDSNSNITFDIEQCPENTTIKTYLNENFVQISENLCGVYKNKKIIYFANTIYVVDIQENKINKIYLKVYNPYFLDKGVIFMEMKANRKDEILFIPAEQTVAQSLGCLKKETTIR